METKQLICGRCGETAQPGKKVGDKHLREYNGSSGQFCTGNIVEESIKWKYTEEERPVGQCPYCYDCKMPYGEFPDMVLHNDLWELISPSHNKGCGLLCPTCIATRLGSLNITEVTVKIFGDGGKLFDYSDYIIHKLNPNIGNDNGTDIMGINER